MLAHILRHVPFELVGNIEDWLHAKHATITETHFWEDGSLPDPAELDLLVIMGGPMSANDEAVHPWLAAERAFIRVAISRGVPTLGICLGAQLIASAHGARVYANMQAEHGWFDVEGLDVPDGVFQFPARFTPFHSHGDTFDLPAGAVHLARSAACEHQAFQLGERCIALQFHLESTPGSAGAIVAECGAAFPAGRYVWTPSEIQRFGGDYAGSKELMFAVLEYLVKGK